MQQVVVLTEYNGMILGPIAKLLGFLMNGIFNLLDRIGIPNIGLSIILFTIVIYLLLLPLTIRQQKFSKLSALMNPELTAIRKKYDGKKDQESMMRMNEETKLVYAKYGVSPTGSCGFMIIQMPILFALYRVIDNIPGYVSRVKDIFFPFVSEFIRQDGALDFIQNKDNFQAAARFAKQFSNELFINGDTDYVTNTVIDVLNKATTAEWANIYAPGNFESLKNLITNVSGTGTYDLFEKYNTFLGLNIANSPSFMFKQGMETHSFLIMVAALIVPVLSAITQWLNVKLTPQVNSQPSGNDQQDTMMQSMKTMNIMMPAMSAVFCFSLPAGMGIYWVAGAVVRCIQQIAINKYLDKEDINVMIEKNAEKMKKKNEKKGSPSALLEKYANMSTKTLDEGGSAQRASMSIKDRASLANQSSSKAGQNASEPSETGSGKKNYKPGSLAEKADLVRRYNENETK